MQPAFQGTFSYTTAARGLLGGGSVMVRRMRPLQWHMRWAWWRVGGNGNCLRELVCATMGKRIHIKTHIVGTNPVPRTDQLEFFKVYEG